MIPPLLVHGFSDSILAVAELVSASLLLNAQRSSGTASSKAWPQALQVATLSTLSASQAGAHVSCRRNESPFWRCHWRLVPATRLPVDAAPPSCPRCRCRVSSCCLSATLPTKAPSHRGQLPFSMLRHSLQPLTVRRLSACEACSRSHCPRRVKRAPAPPPAPLPC